MYDLYRGSTSPVDQADQLQYATSSADSTYGWQPAECVGLAPYICQLPPSVFPCFPPPFPPAPPPQPPSPPSPPLATTCELPKSAMLQAALDVDCIAISFRSSDSGPKSKCETEVNATNLNPRRRPRRQQEFLLRPRREPLLQHVHWRPALRPGISRLQGDDGAAGAAYHVC
jgi:hypothetical protein